MAEDTTRLELTLMRATKPDGKDYYRLEFEEDFTWNEYTGNQVMTWKSDAAKIPEFLEKAKGKKLACDVRVAKEPKWSPSLVKAAIIETGEVVFEVTPFSGSGGGKGGKGGGGGNWESPQERLFKNLSIEAQGSLSRAVDLARAFVHEDAKTGLITFSTEQFHKAADAVIAEMDKFAAAVRESATATPGGSAADAAKVTPPPAEAAPATAVATEGVNPKLALVNTALEHYKTPNKLKAAWEDAFKGDAPDKLAEMDTEELEFLIAEAAKVATA